MSYPRPVEIASTITFLCAPLTPLASSPEKILTWVGRVSILIALLASGAATLCSAKTRFPIYTVVIVVAIACLIGVGLISTELENPQTYVQIAQLLIFGTVISSQRRLGARVSAISLTMVIAAIFLNFAFPASMENDDTHNFSQMVGVFGNPNVLAMYWAVLFIFTLTTAIVAKSRIYSLTSYLIFAILACLVATSSSRAILLATLAFSAIYGVGRLLNGARRFHSIATAFLLLSIPTVLVAYPTALGKVVRLSSSFSQGGGPPGISTERGCVTTSLTHCGDAARKHPETSFPTTTDGGLLGFNKNIASGRQNIWPALIELSGETPVWGHGIGSLPGAYLAWPYQGRSAHNGFLQVYFQFGLVGLALYLIIWCTLFIRAISIPDPASRSMTTAILSAICVIETFEVVFIQNVFGIGVALAILATTEFQPSDSA